MQEITIFNNLRLRIYKIELFCFSIGEMDDEKLHKRQWSEEEMVSLVTIVDEDSGEAINWKKVAEKLNAKHTTQRTRNICFVKFICEFTDSMCIICANLAICTR